jgi:GntP family gluconate:H+ symporter
VYSLITALVATIVAGPLFAFVIVPRLRRSEESADAPAGSARHAGAPRTPPALLPTLVTVLLPVILMLGGSVASLWLPSGHARTIAGFLGSPLVAMAAAVFAALAVFGWRRGVSTRELLQSAERSLWPVAGIVLVVGAGGGFGRVLDQAGVGRAIADAAAAQHLSPLVLGWVLAALLRLSVGSATVAISTGAGLMLPLVETTPGINRELLVVSLGAGSIIASHVNDGGFWLVKEYLNLSVLDTFKMWTVLETLIAVAGLAAVLLLSLVVA